MKNIEIKISINNLNEAQSELKKMGAVFVSEMNQKDTYYHHWNGRLKIREIDGKKHEIIFYKRPNKKNFKISNYQKRNISAKKCHEVKKIYKKTYGEKVVVYKRRQLWLFNNTRIHLDTVKSLGNFLELETAIKGKIKNSIEEFNSVFKTLKLSDDSIIANSYSDILLDTNKAVI